MSRATGLGEPDRCRCECSDLKGAVCVDEWVSTSKENEELIRAWMCFIGEGSGRIGTRKREQPQGGGHRKNRMDGTKAAYAAWPTGLRNGIKPAWCGCACPWCSNSSSRVLDVCFGVFVYILFLEVLFTWPGCTCVSREVCWAWWTVGGEAGVVRTWRGGMNQGGGVVVCTHARNVGGSPKI